MTIPSRTKKRTPPNVAAVAMAGVEKTGTLLLSGDDVVEGE